MKHLSFFVAVCTILACYQSSFGQSPAQLPLHINLGATSDYLAEDGTLYLRDQEWSPGKKYGYVGGVQLKALSYVPFGGTADDALYRHQRAQFDEYKVDSLPTAEYLITLRFAEISVHGAGLVKFALQLENLVVLQNFDPFQAAGNVGEYAIVYRFVVPVEDGTLNIRPIGITGHPHLAALSVDKYMPAPEAPSPPTGASLVPGFESILLDWADSLASDLQGYHVYRASDSDAEFERITREPLRQSRFQDDFKDSLFLTITAAVTKPSQLEWHYKISTIDLENSESEKSSALSASPLAITSTILPVYQLIIDDEKWRQLNRDIEDNSRVPAQLLVEGKQYDVEVRYRGNFTRPYAKKSWKLFFTGESPLPHRSVLNLKSHYDDESLLRGVLTTKVYETLDIQPPSAGLALLFVNEEYYGVYTDYEQVNPDFLAATNRNPDGAIYETLYNESINYGTVLGNFADYPLYYDIKTNEHVGYQPLADLLETFTYTPKEFFPGFINTALDIRAYLKYYAGIIFTSNLDFTRHNVYLLHDSAASEWEVIPWDPDFTWGHHEPFGHSYDFRMDINAGTYDSPSVFNGPNPVLSRLLDVPEYKAYYCKQLETVTDPQFITQKIHLLIDTYHGAVHQAARSDWRKFGWESNDFFEDSRANLKNYATNRALHIRNQMPSFCPSPETLLKINEVTMGVQTTICDPDDPDTSFCRDPWLEIYNPGLESVNLEGFYITNELTNPTRFRINEPLEIPALGYFIIWIDDEPWQGPNHTNFAFSPETGVIALYAPDKKTLIDQFVIGTERQMNVTAGRYPDGADNFYRFDKSSPGGRNRLATSINYVDINPHEPQAGQSVKVEVSLFPESEFTDGFLTYSVSDGSVGSVDLNRIGYGRYEAEIPAFTSGNLVQYHLEVKNINGLVSVSPAHAPLRRHKYLVGYERPKILINEVQASHEDTGQDGENTSSWLELTNVGNDTIDLGGMYLSNDRESPKMYRISPNMQIAGRGVTVFFANGTPDLSIWHANFVLQRSGGEVLLFDRDENYNQLITAYRYSTSPVDGSLQRCPNNASVWQNSPTPTLSLPNAPFCEIVYLPVTFDAR